MGWLGTHAHSSTWTHAHDFEYSDSNSKSVLKDKSKPHATKTGAISSLEPSH